MSRVRRALPGSLVTLALLASGCPERKTVVEQPDDAPVTTPSEVDVLGLCEAGCERLTRCVPDLALSADASPDEIAARLAAECEPACTSFAAPLPTAAAALRLEVARESALALEACLPLDSCNAYWGCVSSEAVRPWLAAVAPVGDRTCENLCSQASACAIAKVCEVGDKERDKDKDKEREAAKAPVDPLCQTDGTRRDELEESCLLQCFATPEGGQARQELLGCLDHVSCGGMLECLDTWADTAYRDEGGPAPGLSPTCDAFCTRAIECGAQANGVELTPAEIAALREIMTSTFVECGVQCEKDLQRGDAQKQTFEQCTASADCSTFLTCADAA